MRRDLMICRMALALFTMGNLSCIKPSDPGDEEVTFSGITETDDTGNFSGTIDLHDWGKHSYDRLYVTQGFWMEKPENDTLAFRSSHPGVVKEAHLTVCNLSPSALSVSPSVPAPFFSQRVDLQSGERKALTVSYILPDSTRFTYVGTLTVTFSSGEVKTLTATAAPESSDSVVVSRLPSEYCLYPAYPNPTDGSVAFHFSIPQKETVSLVVSSPVRTVRTVLPAQSRTAGVYAVTWDLLDDQGSRAAPGIYRATLTAGAYSAEGDILVK